MDRSPALAVVLFWNPVMSLNKIRFPVAVVLLIAALGDLAVVMLGDLHKDPKGICLALLIVPLAAGGCFLLWGANRFTTTLGILLAAGDFAVVTFGLLPPSRGPALVSVPPGAWPTPTATSQRSCVQRGTTGGPVEDLTRWATLGQATSTRTATSLVTQVAPGEYSLNGWILQGLGLCNFDLSFTAIITTPPPVRPRPGDNAVGWGYAVGVCMNRSNNGNLHGALLHYDFANGPKGMQHELGIRYAPADKQWGPFFEGPELLHRTFRPGQQQVQSWVLQVRDGRVTAVYKADSNNFPPMTWAATGATQDPSAPSLPARCGPGADGGDDVVFRVWGTTVAIDNPVITPVAVAP